MKGSDDQSLFAWCLPNVSSEAYEFHGLLAKSPLNFIDSGTVRHEVPPDVHHSYAMTNKGLHITLHMAQLEGDFYIALLHCTNYENRVAIVLLKFPPGDRYFRVAVNSLNFQEAINSFSFLEWDETRELCCLYRTIYVPKALSFSESMNPTPRPLRYSQISIYGSSAKVVSYLLTHFQEHH